jgi:LEA14-like dessication related protein
MLQRTSPTLRGACLLAATLALSSCSGFGLDDVVRQPEVDIVGFEVTEASLLGAQLLFEFEVDNPNALALVLDGIGYSLRLNGERLLDGRHAQRTEIAARGASRIRLPVRVSFSDLARVIKSFEGRTRPDYDLQADFQFDVPVLGSVVVPVHEQGEIPMNRVREFLDSAGVSR